MGKRIGAIISLVILVVVMTGMALAPMSVSAAESQDECKHLALTVDNRVTRYLHADNYTHQKVVITKYSCKICGEKITVEETTKEPHSVDPEKNKCACGFSPQIH